MLPVDLVVNGEYYGSYLLAEQIRIGKYSLKIVRRYHLIKDVRRIAAVTVYSRDAFRTE